MGINVEIVEALAREHVYKPLAGDALFIGRQTVYYTVPGILDMFQDHGIEPAIDPRVIEIDTSTRNRSKEYADKSLITDASLMKLFGARTVKALDHSSWENADLIHDLREPLPESLRGIADILIDGSTLDNVFTPSIVLQNFTELLRPGGRMFLANSYSSLESAYVIMPPMWYVDYFVMNGFADCRVYVVVCSEHGRNVFFVSLADAHRLGVNMGFFPVKQYHSFTVVFAEKGDNSTSDRLPIQQHYRPSDEWNRYNDNLKVMLASRRPHLVRSNSDPFLADIQGGYHYINRGFLEDDAALMRAQAPKPDPAPKTIRRRLSQLLRS